MTAPCRADFLPKNPVGPDTCTEHSAVCRSGQKPSAILLFERSIFSAFQSIRFTWLKRIVFGQLAVIIRQQQTAYCGSSRASTPPV
jgi:hypothetical protein